MLLDTNLRVEYQNLVALLKKVHSPVIFCHNDFQEGNILYMVDSLRLESWFPEGPVEQMQDIVKPIDFEYASDNYRGFDV